MAVVESKMVPLGSPAPDFKLKAVDGKTCTLRDFADKKILAVIFMCNHCPYVKATEDRIVRLARDYEKKGVQVVGICSNDPADYPDDSFDNLKKRWREKEYGFPYLWDETQSVARAYNAQCTPDIYVYDEGRKLRYRGRIDDNWKDAKKVTRHDLRNAIDLMLQGVTPPVEQIPSMGCSIKWKK